MDKSNNNQNGDKKSKEQNGPKDEEILALSQEDPSYFALLVNKYHEPFLRMARGITHNLEEAEDIIQEVFVKVYSNAGRFQKLPGIQFKSWAYKILMNTAFTHYQKLKKTKGNVEYLDPVLYEDNPKLAGGMEFVYKNDARNAINKVIDKMPQHLGSPLKKYYFDDMSYENIAKNEKISISTLKMRMFRAKRMFKKLMDQDAFS